MDWSQLDCVVPSCIDVCVAEPRPLSLHERAKLNCERAEALAAQDEVQPPWRFFSERYAILEAEAEHQIIAVASWPVEEFLATLHVAKPDAAFERGLPSLLPVGRGALRDSPALAHFRASIVPAKVDESSFWFCFFEHVRAIRASLMPPRPVVRSTSEEQRADADDFEQFLASPLKL